MSSAAGADPPLYVRGRPDGQVVLLQLRKNLEVGGGEAETHKVLTADFWNTQFGGKARIRSRTSREII